MITKATGYQSSDGRFHATLDDAKWAELRPIIGTAMQECEIGCSDIQAAKFTRLITEASDVIIDILTMKPNSLPKARKINGGTKKRTKQSAQNTLPLDTTEPPRAA